MAPAAVAECWKAAAFLSIAALAKRSLRGRAASRRKIWNIASVQVPLLGGSFDIPDENVIKRRHMPPAADQETALIDADNTFSPIIQFPRNRARHVPSFCLHHP